MTNNILESIVGGIVFGIIVGLIIGFSLRKKSKNNPCEIDSLPSGQERVKQENIGKIKAYLSDYPKVTNEEVAMLLSVSNATVVRYMDELEKQNLVKQVGKTGVKTYYKKTS